jgi:LuxR family transcriptional regulator
MYLEDYQNHFADLSPGGCYIALRLGFFAPEAELNLFSPDWINFYTLSGFALVDPLLRWCQQNDGAARWSEVSAHAGSDVAGHYRQYGYTYGTVISIRGTATQRKHSLGIFARRDREPMQKEMQGMRQILSDLHMYEAKLLTPAQAEALRLYAQGLTQKETADRLGVSVSAVKARLRAAADRVGVKTPVEAAFVAARRGLL